MTTRARLYPLLGATLSTGAPVGWLLLRLLQGEVAPGAVFDEVRAHADLYLYLLLATTTAFSLFGAVLGRMADSVLAANQRLAGLAVSDGLTGLKNARYFQARLAEEVSRSARERTPLALVMADLDHFKQVNDGLGHPVGDEVLTRIAELVLSLVREGDSACRVGGEEFAIVCPSTGREDALALAERIRAAVARVPVRTSAGQVPLTVSLGVAVLAPGETAEDLLRAADQALYQAKRAGRNQVAAMPTPACALA